MTKFPKKNLHYCINKKLNYHYENQLRVEVKPTKKIVIIMQVIEKTTYSKDFSQNN